MATDQATLDALNREYIRSVSEADVRWFDANLAEDFVNSNPDCSLVDRQGLPRPDRARLDREESRHRGRGDPRAGRRGADPRPHHVHQGRRSARRRALHRRVGATWNGWVCVAANVTRL
jgi:hypothetical protein